MVLKKSNSCFNSGATQRLTNRGALKSPQHFSRDFSCPGTITVVLSGHEDLSSENLSTFEDALETIYKSLNWHGPNLSSFYDKDGFPRVQRVFNEFNFIKHQTTGCKSMLDRVKEMIDANILETMAHSIEIDINIKRLRTHKADNITILSWKSTDKKELPIYNSKIKKMDRKKKQFNQHNRGLQRPQRISYQENREEQQNDSQIPSRKIQITVQEPHHNDARLVTFAVPTRHRVRYECRRHPINQKASLKSKSYVHGRRSDFKGYNFETLQCDETEALLDVLEEEEHSEYTYPEEFLNSVNSFEDEEEDVNELFLSKKGRCLGDCLTSFNQPYLQYDIKNKINKSNLTPVNSASSEEILRHPKGSYVYMKKTREATLSDIDSGMESDSIDTSDSQIDDIEEINSFSLNQSGSSIDSGYAKNVQFNLISHVTNFISKFFPVKFTLPEKLETQIQNFSPLNGFYINGSYQVDDCIITLGNCYPPSFIVKAKTDMANYDHNYFLIGKAFQSLEDHAWTWQLQVGNETTCDPDLKVTEMFFDSLQINDNTTLQNIVETFQESISFNQTNLITQSQLKCKSNSFSFSTPKSESPWLKLKHIISDHSHSVCIEEALKGSLNITNQSSSLHSPVSEISEKLMENVKAKDNTKDVSQLENKLSITDCDICFLPYDFCEFGDSQAVALIPCGHTFCLNCWSSHVFISLYTGDPISCMNTDCKHKLNETMLKTLAPGYMVNKWYQRVQDKEIEKNPKSKWCPNTRCDQVGIISKLSDRINAFGNLVFCDCQIPWCFNCQTEPHWPASCDQMAAFRKLLDKTGNDLEIPARRADYFIELKRCPRCHYPIEKNQGCPSMVCRMCWFNFCWNCLRAVDHSVYTCKPRGDNYTTFNLQNKLVHDLPLKYFPDYLKMNKKKEEIEKRSILIWVNSIQFQSKRKLKIPLAVSVKLANDGEAKKNAKRIVQSSVHFVRQVYTLLEPYYVLLCFVNMNKELPRKTVNSLLNEFSCLAENLRFIVWRFEEKILYKNMSHILNYAETADMMLDCGKKHIRKVKQNIHILQKLSKNIDPTPIGEMDPKKFLRYK